MGVEDSQLRMSKFSCLPGFPRVSLVVISGNSDLIERWSESKAITPDWSRFPREAVTDVTARLPKHLMVDTLERRHNTDQHDGCQIQTNPAFTSFEFMHGEACQGRGMMWTLPVCQVFLRPRPVIVCQASHLLSYGSLPKRPRFNVYRLTGRKSIRFKGVTNDSVFNPQYFNLIGSGFHGKLI